MSERMISDERKAELDAMTIPSRIMDEAREAFADIDQCETASQAIDVLATALLAAEQRGREEERERCAKIAETAETPEDGEYWIASRIATAIRTEKDKG